MPEGRAYHEGMAASPASYQRTESSKRSPRRWASPRHHRPSSSLEGQKAGPIGGQRIILGSHQSDLTELLLLGTFPPAGLSAQALIHRSAWKGNSAQFGCKMLDDTLLGVRADRGSSGIDDRVPTVYGTAE